ncbi:MAG: hypothetical protein JWP97_5346, partial [Labilithrix sp.]|nr:hypothetical protein [Labilithrix sp.]
PAMPDGPAPAVDAGPPPAVITAGDASVAAPVRAKVELHLVYVNGLIDPANYAKGEGTLVSLDKAVLAAVKARLPAYEAANDVDVTVDARRINVYTDLNGNVPTPGTDDGSGAEVAVKWRSQLAAKLAKAFPKGEKNIVLIGHSTGGRVSMEMAADVGGPSGLVGFGNWGWRDRIAGVVSVHGMLDALGGYTTSPRVVSFELGCKTSKKSGWCEYAANISAVPAADWVAVNKRSLVLTGEYDDCGFPIWGETSDNALPLRAQGSPASVGFSLAKLSGGQYSVAHGTLYGRFCHSDITSGTSPRHQQSVTNATNAIVKWLFDSAPRVMNPLEEDQAAHSPTLSGGASSVVRPVPAACPAGWKGAGLSLAGNCSHPGFTDGDDHPMTAAQLVATKVGCGGSVQWKNTHGDGHAGTLWFKAYGEPAAKSGLLDALARE